MPIFPLPLPAPVDLEFGRSVLEANPKLIEGDFLVNLKGFISDRVTYRFDGTGSDQEQNYWVPPSQVLAQGSGDCEDVALLALSISEAAGFRGQIAFYYDLASKKGHTVAVWQRSACCGFVWFVLEARQPGTDPDDGLPVGPISAWETTDLGALRTKFGYPSFEVVR